MKKKEDVTNAPCTRQLASSNHERGRVLTCVVDPTPSQIKAQTKKKTLLPQSQAPSSERAASSSYSPKLEPSNTNADPCGLRGQ